MRQRVGVDGCNPRFGERAADHRSNRLGREAAALEGGAIAYPISTTPSAEGAPLYPPSPTSVRGASSTNSSVPQSWPPGRAAYDARERHGLGETLPAFRDRCIQQSTDVRRAGDRRVEERGGRVDQHDRRHIAISSHDHAAGVTVVGIVELWTTIA